MTHAHSIDHENSQKLVDTRNTCTCNNNILYVRGYDILCKIR